MFLSSDFHNSCFNKDEIPVRFVTLLSYFHGLLSLFVSFKCSVGFGVTLRLRVSEILGYSNKQFFSFLLNHSKDIVLGQFIEGLSVM